MQRFGGALGTAAAARSAVNAPAGDVLAVGSVAPVGGTMPEAGPTNAQDTKPSRLAALTAPLPLINNPAFSKLTRSERLFYQYTAQDPRSLAIDSRGTEWFVFADLRRLHQWATNTMTPQGVQEATRLYNAALEERNRRDNIPHTIRKAPRALIDRLADFELRVKRQLAAKRFNCKSLLPSK